MATPAKPYRYLRPLGNRSNPAFQSRRYVLEHYFSKELRGTPAYYEIAVRMAKLERIRPTDTVLDVGAGVGFGAWAFFPLPGTITPGLQRPKKYIGVEPTRAMANGLAMYLAAPNKRISTYGPLGKTKLRKGTEILIGRAENLGKLLANRKVDKVFMSNVLHWTNQLQTLRAIRKVIKKDGRLVFDADYTMHGPMRQPLSGTLLDRHPFARSFKASVARQLRQLGFSDPGLFGAKTKPMYSLDQLLKDIEESGFEVTKKEWRELSVSSKDFLSWARITKMWFDAVPKKGRPLSPAVQEKIIETALREASKNLGKGPAVTNGIIFVCKPK